MNHSDKQDFWELMNSTYKMYNCSLPIANELKIWWASLKEFSFEVVSLAFSEHINKNKFKPRVAEIRAIIELARDLAKSKDRTPLLYHRMSAQERVEGLRRLHIAKDKLG